MPHTEAASDGGLVLCAWRSACTEPSTQSGSIAKQRHLPLLGIKSHERPDNFLHDTELVARLTLIERARGDPLRVALSSQGQLALDFGNLLGQCDHAWSFPGGPWAPTVVVCLDTLLASLTPPFWGPVRVPGATVFRRLFHGRLMLAAPVFALPLPLAGRRRWRLGLGVAGQEILQTLEHCSLVLASERDLDLPTDDSNMAIHTAGRFR